MWHSQREPSRSATEAEPQSLLRTQTVSAQFWGYSLGNQGKATLASHPGKKGGGGVYKNQVQKKKIIISGIKLFTNTVAAQEIISSECRAQALKLLSASRFRWADPLPPPNVSPQGFNGLKKILKIPHTTPQRNFPNTATE